MSRQEQIPQLQLVLGPLAGRDVPDVALDDLLVVHFVDVAHELHRGHSAAHDLERQIFVTDIFPVLQFGKRCLRGGCVGKNSDLPQALAFQLLPRSTGQVLDKRVRVDNAAGVVIENQDSVLR